ncbi:MAG TPA: glycosyltransferase [Burkholderiales bacterium]|nr:glycosyltransferase [Burkholderiales bacterium]
MKLVFATGSLVHGGAERHSITLANRLAERGHECRFAYVRDDSSQLHRLHAAASAECLHARRYLDLAAVQRLATIMKGFTPSAVIAANPYAMMYAALALRQARVAAPLAVTFHTTLLAGPKEWLKMLLYRPFFWRADCLAFVCDAQRRHWLRRLVAARANRVIYNGVDPEHWRSPGPETRERIRRVLGVGAADYVIAMCAVFRPEKNHLQLVEALAHLRRRGIAARALLIGDGPMRPAIEARARSLGVAGDVLVTGLQQDVRPFLAAADAVTLCSTSVETFSLAALEAMALGLPVVLSDIGGAVDMVRPGREGFLFPAGDTHALVERLAALSDAGLRRRMGAAARDTVEARFSERAMVDSYESLLQQLVLTRSERDNLRRSATAHQG